MDTSLFDYDLPPEAIAQHPPRTRGDSRMLLVPRDGGPYAHLGFAQLPGLLRAGDCLVLNDTRVLPARLLGRRPTGGQAEVFLLKRLGVQPDVWEALVRPARRTPAGTRVEFGAALTAKILDTPVMGRTRVELNYAGLLEEVLAEVGITPLPPYIRRESALPADRERYQTVYARAPGAVAAPTAGLHFTQSVLDELADAGVECVFLTLHVGLGTFSPISAERIEDHTMHTEQYHVAAEVAERVNARRDAGGRVVAVGTTAVRTLESCADESGRIVPGAGETGIYISPGYRFRAIDGMLTNFHLPRSSLIVMVAAFIGRERVLDAYRVAIAHGYRFYSYGDCMLII
ncbi:MAG TPA: tRNA preQ1(34) S-adenosylmethionine ribosyltransferase-isomerase QueA [Armatimonadetes bacterium]|nr:tRNA preQ1(34) S-adenosylmethionine ribosyltransferase-isomerase QueA [Armatimonadota bacterium]